MITNTGTKVSNGMTMIDLLDVAVDDLWNQIMGANDIDHGTFVEMDILRTRVWQIRQALKTRPLRLTDEQCVIYVAQLFGALQHELTKKK